MLVEAEKEFIVQKTIFPFFTPTQLVLPYWVEGGYLGNGFVFQ